MAYALKFEICCSTETLTAYRGVGAAAVGAAAVGMVLGLGVGAARANRIDEVEEIAELIANIAEDADTGFFQDRPVGEFNGFVTTPLNQFTITV